MDTTPGSLTVNSGLRYDIQTMPELKGSPLEPRTSKFSTDNNSWAPRFGLSWDPGENQKTVIRIRHQPVRRASDRAGYTHYVLKEEE